MRESIVIKFNKEFVKGNQYINIHDYNGKTFQDNTPMYYWQSRDVFNILISIVEYIELNCKVKLTDKQLYGKGSIIDRLVPYQRQYNALRNRNIEYLNRLTYPCVFVEDGSVDIDNLEEEGLSPGKILVYRQGSHMPEIKVVNGIEVYDKLKQEAEEVKQEMWVETENFLKRF